MHPDRPDGWQELEKPRLNNLYNAIQHYFYTFHDSMDNKVLSELGSGWVDSELEKDKDGIINCVEDLATIIGEKDAFTEARNKWDYLARLYEDDFKNRSKPFSLINMDFEQRIGKIF